MTAGRFRTRSAPFRDEILSFPYSTAFFAIRALLYAYKPLKRILSKSHTNYTLPYFGSQCQAKSRSRSGRSPKKAENAYPPVFHASRPNRRTVRPSWRRRGSFSSGSRRAQQKPGKAAGLEGKNRKSEGMADFSQPRIAAGWENPVPSPEFYPYSFVPSAGASSVRSSCAEASSFSDSPGSG